MLIYIIGTPALPPHLDFYNMEDSDENSYTSVPGTPKSYSRPMTPSHRGALFFKDEATDQDSWGLDSDLGTRLLVSDLFTLIYSTFKYLPINLYIINL